MKIRLLNKRGINLISLICIVVVMLIITGTVIVSFDNIYTSSIKKSFANELYNIQKLVDEYHFKYGKYPTIGDEIELNVYELDLYELGVNEANRGRKNKNNLDDVYVVNTSTGKIKYKKGVNIGGIEYDRLDENNEINLILKEKGK